MRSSYLVSRQTESASLLSRVLMQKLDAFINGGHACCRSWPWMTSSATGTTSWLSKLKNRTHVTVYYIKSPTQINQYITIFLWYTYGLKLKNLPIISFGNFFYIFVLKLCWLKFDQLIFISFYLTIIAFQFLLLWVVVLPGLACHWNSNHVWGCGNNAWGYLFWIICIILPSTSASVTYYFT